jgi:hypothetical protein
MPLPAADDNRSWSSSLNRNRSQRYSSGDQEKTRGRMVTISCGRLIAGAEMLTGTLEPASVTTTPRRTHPRDPESKGPLPGGPRLRGGGGPQQSGRYRARSMQPVTQDSLRDRQHSECRRRHFDSAIAGETVAASPLSISGPAAIGDFDRKLRPNFLLLLLLLPLFGCGPCRALPRYGPPTSAAWDLGRGSRIERVSVRCLAKEWQGNRVWSCQGSDFGFGVRILSTIFGSITFVSQPFLDGATSPMSKRLG